MTAILPNTEAVRCAVSSLKEKYGIEGKFTKTAYRRICKAENIVPVELDLNQNAYYVVTPGTQEEYIFIKKELDKRRFLEIAAHHLGNHFLHFEIVVNPALQHGSPEYLTAHVEADMFSELITNSSILDAKIIESILDAEVI